MMASLGYIVCLCSIGFMGVCIVCESRESNLARADSSAAEKKKLHKKVLSTTIQSRADKKFRLYNATWRDSIISRRHQHGVQFLKIQCLRDIFHTESNSANTIRILRDSLTSLSLVDMIGGAQSPY